MPRSKKFAIVTRDHGVELVEIKTSDEQVDQGDCEQAMTQPLRLFLEAMKITQEDLQRHNISIELLERLMKIETTWFGQLRWSNVDYFIERVLLYPFISQNSVLNITYANNKLFSKRLWVQGRGMLFQSSSAISSSVAVNTFRVATELVAFNLLKALFLGLSIYSVASMERPSFNDWFDGIWSSENQNIRRLIVLAFGKFGNAFKYGLVLPLLISPFVWGLSLSVKSCFQKNVLSKDEFDRFIESCKNYPENIWHDYIRWFLPRPPLNSAINQLESMLRWQGVIDTASHEIALNALKKLATERKGYTKTSALHVLSHIAHGMSFSQFLRMKNNDSQKEYLTLLAIKIQSADLLLSEYEDYRIAWSKTRSVEALTHNLYIQYLNFTLGLEKNRLALVLFYSYKLVTLFLSLKIFPKIIEEILAYLKCPNKQFDFQSGEFPKEANLFLPACFAERVRNFRQIPGEPVSNLIQDFPSFNLANVRCLNLSGKTLSANETAQILRALYYNDPPVILWSLSLSNNVIVDIDGIHEFMQYLHEIKVLDLSENNMGLLSSNPLTAFSENLKFTPELQSLNLANNLIGFIDSNGTQALANQLRYVPKLETLNLANNQISSMDTMGAIAIGKALAFLPQLRELDLSLNLIGNWGSLGTQIIGNNLKYVTNLRALDLSSNYIGIINSYGMEAVFSGIQYLTQLRRLNLANNFFDPTDVQTLASSLRQCQQLEYFSCLPQGGNVYFSADSIALLNSAVSASKASQSFNYLNTLQEVEVFLNTLENSTSIIYLANRLYSPPLQMVEYLMQGLRRFNQLKTLDLSNCQIEYGINSFTTQALGQGLSYLTTLEELNLSGNQIEIVDTFGAQAIASSFSSLPNLVRLNLSNNLIGVNDPAYGAQALGQGFKHLKKLKYLDLSINQIGTAQYSGVPSLGEGLGYLSELRLLNMSFNSLYGELSPILYSFNGTQRLESIDFSSNAIGYAGSSGVQVFGQQLRYLTELKLLDLSNNAIGFTDQNGTIALSKGLASRTQLECLNLAGNSMGSMGPEGPTALLSILPNLQNLQSINLASMTHVNPTLAILALSTQNAKKYQETCQNNLCFSQPLKTPLNTCGNTIPGGNFCQASSPSTRLQLPWPYQMMGNMLRGLYDHINRVSKAIFSNTKEFVIEKADALADQVIEGICETVDECESYFPKAPLIIHQERTASTSRHTFFYHADLSGARQAQIATVTQWQLN